MGIIKQLSEDLIKKIAAGEVIERPASVIKELVENSIDAGSTKIEICVERAGKYIRVSDNGSGIDPSDIELLFTRHATSKLKSFDDLWNINTLGFRGEALASISAISKVTCRSKHKDQEHGFEIKVIDEKTNKSTSGISIGTVFEIDDLFYNVPARQKFLKSEQTEMGHIYDVILSEALSHPEVAFSLLNHKNVLLQSSGSGELKQVLIETLGQDLRDNLIPVKARNNFLELNGFISNLEVYRSDKKSIFTFINQRPVKCPILSKAISSAYEGLLQSSKYPIMALSLAFKSRFVDVNVHPAKKEVRYTQPNDVYNLILRTIQDSVSDYYKGKYQNQSVYSLPELAFENFIYESKQNNYDQIQSFEKTSSRLSNDESLAAIDLYSNIQPLEQSEKDENNENPKNLDTPLNVSNLTCRVILSDKPIANITRIANKAIFEVGTIFDKNIQIVFSGEILGDNLYQRAFFDQLFELSNQIYKIFSTTNDSIQQQLLISDQTEEEPVTQNRKKPSKEILYKIWERDNWTCVYCNKQLLDPETANQAIPFSTNAFVKYLNEKGEEITSHLIKEHAASYDHYLPVSKLPQFGFESDNLYACCFNCNRKKSNSMNLKEWEPNRQNSWKQPLILGGINFTAPRTFLNKLKT